MLESFIWRALIAGIGVALVAGPMGCFVIWRRLAYFGDTMAHASLLGVALGLLLHWHIVGAVVVVTILVALLLVMLQRRPGLASDTLLGILSHATLAAGLVVLGLMTWLRVDVMGYLFGDILAVSPQEIMLIYAGGGCTLVVLAIIWRPLLATTVHEDLARAEGVSATRVQMIFMLLLSLVIAIAMKVIGVMLLTSLLIIPAATARRFATSPELMALFAALFGCIAVALGLTASLLWDLASGPSIVLAACSCFVVSLFFPNPQRA
ncbi:MAG: metal ABC transporter permease [Magnetococcales bacterium]|nr:metal ABC transporter permease [Magnetococcales bacterium]MBF0321559.1 metal ABC transporter permease [Magnetococcales bacterium]